MGTPEQQKIYLKSCGSLFLFFAAWSIVRFFMEIGDNLQSIKDAWQNFPPEAMMGAMIGMLVVVTLVYLYLGIAAFCQANGKWKGSGHIVVAYVILVLDSILTVLSVIGLIMQKADVLTLCQGLAAFGILFWYVKSATNLRKQQ